jgi:hypothetical protein
MGTPSSLAWLQPPGPWSNHEQAFIIASHHPALASPVRDDMAMQFTKPGSFPPIDH